MPSVDHNLSEGSADKIHVSHYLDISIISLDKPSAHLPGVKRYCFQTQIQATDKK